MTKYVHAPGGVVSTYPYSYKLLLRDNPNVSFPALPGEWLADFSVFPIEETPTPDVPRMQNLVESLPEFSNGAWRQVWTLVDASAEEIEKRQEQDGQSAELANAKEDAWLTQFLAMSPTEAQDYINNNSSNLAALRSNVARMAYVLRVLVRREFNR